MQIHDVCLILNPPQLDSYRGCLLKIPHITPLEPGPHSPFNQCTTIPLVVCYIESQKKKYYLPVDLSVLFLQDNNSRLPPYNCSYSISLRKKSKKYATYQAQI